MPASRRRSDRRTGFVEGLNAIDGALHVQIEILHADAGARHARLRQRRDGLVFEAARIDLDGEFGVRRDFEMRLQRRASVADVVGRQHGRRAAAPMDMRDRMSRADDRGDDTRSLSSKDRDKTPPANKRSPPWYGSRRTSTACRKTEHADKATAAWLSAALPTRCETSSPFTPA